MTRGKAKWRYPEGKPLLQVPLTDADGNVVEWVAATDDERQAHAEVEQFINADHRQRTFGRMDR
jgi:hypothetical protein